MHARTLRLVGLVVAAVGVGASCGREPPPPPQQIPAAASKTLQAGSSRIAVVAESDAGWKLTADGRVDYRERRGELALHDIAALALPAPEGAGIVILDGNNQFLRLPQASPLAPGRPWVLVNLERAEAQDVDVSTVRRLLRLDPVPALTLLQAAGGDAQKVATEEVAGAETTHYETTVDTAAAGTQLPPALRRYFQRSMAPLGPTVAVDVWVDGAGRVRRLRYSPKQPPAPAPARGGPAGKITTTLELSEFGAAAAVRNPPGGEIVPVTDLLEPTDDP